MLGRVIDVALGFVKSNTPIGHSLPTQRWLAEQVQTSPSMLSRFIGGDPVGTNWTLRTERLLELIVCGLSAPTPEVASTSRRIVRYFFGSSERESLGPRYFRGNRIRCPDPWSRRELAREIRWLARQQGLTRDRGPSRVLAFSGRAGFLEGAGSASEDNDMLQAIMHAAREGASIAYAAPNGTPAWQSVEIVRRSMPPEASFTAWPVRSESAPLPVVQLLLLSWHNFDGSADHRLFLVRPSIDEGPLKELQPLATTCNAAELRQFVDWIRPQLAEWGRPDWLDGGPMTGEKPSNRVLDE